MTNSSGKIRIGEKEVTTIMFADDLVLLADSSAGLKQSLLTLGAHAQRGLLVVVPCVCVCVCVCVSVCLSVTTILALQATRRPKSDTNGLSAM